MKFFMLCTLIANVLFGCGMWAVIIGLEIRRDPRASFGAFIMACLWLGVGIVLLIQEIVQP